MHPLFLSTYGYDTRIRVGVQCIRACDAVMASMHELKLPLLVFHSTADTLTDPDGSKMLYAAVKVRVCPAVQAAQWWAG